MVNLAVYWPFRNFPASLFLFFFKRETWYLVDLVKVCVFICACLYVCVSVSVYVLMLVGVYRGKRQVHSPVE